MFEDSHLTPQPTPYPTSEPTKIPQGSIEIVNSSDTWVIEYVYISDTNSSQWGDNQLDTGEIIDKLSNRIFDVDTGSYDVMIGDDFGNQYYQYNVFVEPWTTVSLTYDGSSFEISIK
jgi:hypothetical protein